MCLPGDVEEELDLGVGCQVCELWWVSELKVRSLSEGDAGFNAGKIDIIRISLGTFGRFSRVFHIRQYEAHTHLLGFIRYLTGCSMAVLIPR